MTKNDAKVFKARVKVKVDVEVATTECWIEVQAADLDELDKLIVQVVKRFEEKRSKEAISAEYQSSD